MAYSVDNKQFAGKIKSIKASTSHMRDQVQDALIAATYLCLKNSGGTSPFQNILDAVGSAAHRQGIVQWSETYAPVLLRKDKILLNKSAYETLDRDGILADFDAFIAESGMDDTKWWSIAASKNTTVSIFDADKSLELLFKKLEKNELPGLAAHLRKAVDEYSAQTTAAIREAMASV